MDANAFDDFNFADAFETWELQSGYPVIHVTRDKDQSRFQITQKRYLNAETNSVDSNSWFIPLNFAHASNPDFDDLSFTHYFEHDTTEKIISTENIQGFDDDEWFVFNKQQLGYYRVNYDLENWQNIIAILNSEQYQQIHVLNRAQLVDDAMNFAIDGHIEFEVALNVLKYLQREVDYLPWASAVPYLERLDYLLLDDEVREKFHEFISHIVARLYVTHGLEQTSEEEFLTRNAREVAINWLCRSGNQKCLSDAYAEIHASMVEERPLPKPLEISFLCNGIKGSGKTDEFAYFWNKTALSTDQADRLRIIDGLACATDPDIVQSLLETTISESSDVDYRLHERVRVFNSVLSSSSVGIAATLDFLSEHSADIQEL